jgi:hypothetical protein
LELRVRYIGEDFWGRKLYENVETKRVYADVDGRLHTITPNYGEPEYPLDKNYNIIIVEED